jgi:hypothetical protein
MIAVQRVLQLFEPLAVWYLSSVGLQPAGLLVLAAWLLHASQHVCAAEALPVCWRAAVGERASCRWNVDAGTTGAPEPAPAHGQRRVNSSGWSGPSVHRVCAHRVPWE